MTKKLGAAATSRFAHAVPGGVGIVGSVVVAARQPVAVVASGSDVRTVVASVRPSKVACRHRCP